MTCPRSRTVLALLVAVTLAAAALPPGVVGDHGDPVDWPDDSTRAFYADDPDGGDVTDATAEGDGLLANVTDFYYRTTAPTFTANGTTLAEYRRQQLLSVERTDDDSKYLPFSERKDGAGGVIEDAHVTFLGVVGGGRPTLNDDAAPLYVPSEGEVLNYLDYRVDGSDVPDDYTEEVTPNITKEHRYSLDSTEVEERVVRIDGREVGRASESPNPRTIRYDGASGSGTVSLTVRAEIRVRIEHEIETIRDLGNTTETDIEEETITRTVTVSDSEEVRVVGDQSVQLRQRLVVVEGGNDRLLVTFDGPETLAGRQLWSRLNFEGPSVVVNNWGVYSTTQYAHGYVSDGDEDTYPFPHVLAVNFTSSFAAPYASTNYSAGTASASPRVVRVEQTNYSDETPTLPQQVNLTASHPTFVHQFAVRDAPSRIQSATGLFGREIEIQNETPLVVEAASIEISKVNDSHAEVRLFDADSGEGIPGRTLSLSGAASESVTTGPDGVAVVNRTHRTLRASFDSQWREAVRNGEFDPSRTYYTSARDDLLVIEMGLLVTGLIEVFTRFVLAFPFVLGWVWIRSMDTVL